MQRLFPFPDSPLWNRLPDKGGLDIADWITELKLSKEGVMDAIGKRPITQQGSESVKSESVKNDRVIQTVGSVLERITAIYAIEEEAEQLWQLGLLSKSVGRPVRDLLNIWEAHKDSSLKFSPLALNVLFARPELERRWLLGGLIPSCTVIGLIASGGTGKTLLAYDLVKSIASGLPWNGFPVNHGKCLIVQTDEQWTDTVDRLDIAGFRDIDPNQVMFVEHWQFAHLHRLAEFIKDQGISFCVIDSFTSTNRRSAAEEKDTAYAKCLYDLRDLASQSGCTFLVLHHTNKSGGARGTTAFEDNVSEVWFLTREQLEGFTPQHRQLEIRKSRSGCTGKYKLFLDVEEYSWQLEGDVEEGTGSKPLVQRILEYLQGLPGAWIEPDELTYAFPESKSRDAIRKHLERLRKKGLVEADDRIKDSMNASGKIRYRVYRYPINQSGSIKKIYIPTSPDSYVLGSTDVQQAEPSPRANSTLLDMDGCPHIENEQNRGIKNTYTSSINIGDRVRYVGRGEHGIFTLKGIRSDVLTVVAVKDDRADVSSLKWVTTQNIPLKDLQKVR